jgi:hypothetical protein
MSAEVLGSVPVPAPAAQPSPAPRRSLSPAVLEPSLVTRLVAVATAIFAAPAAVELYALAAGSGAPSLAATLAILLAAAVLAAGFGGLVVTAPRTAALRTARVLCAALAAETAVLAAAAAWQLLG